MTKRNFITFQEFKKRHFKKHPEDLAPYLDGAPKYYQKDGYIRDLFRRASKLCFIGHKNSIIYAIISINSGGITCRGSNDMNYWNKKLIRRQLDKKLASLKSFALAGNPQQGWIKSIREALGMSASQLAARIGLDQSRVSRLEHAEKTGDLRVSSLQKIAKGLNMRFVYGFVPENTLEESVRRRARAAAIRSMKRLNNTMLLEKQGLGVDEKKEALNDMIEKILAKPPKDFWDKKYD